MVAIKQGDWVEGLGTAGVAVGGVMSVQAVAAGPTQPISGTVDTELPAAVALSDTLANPTTPMVGAADLSWQGNQWTRGRAPQATPGLFVAASSAANTTITLTLPAGPAGTLIFVTYIRLHRFATAALAAAAELLYTSTNLGGWDLSTDNGMTANVARQDYVGDGQPLLVASTTATAVTIIAPACGAAVLSRLRAAFYYA